MKTASLRWLAIVLVWGFQSTLSQSAKGVTLQGMGIKVEIGGVDGGLVGLSNELTGVVYEVQSIPFQIVTNQGELTPANCPGEQTARADEEVSFRYRCSDLQVVVSYELKRADHFLHKSYRVTNHGGQPVVIEKVTMWQAEFTPGFRDIHPHRSGSLGNVPLCFFLRDKTGGLFAGVENPYFELRLSGDNALHLPFEAYVPLSPGETYQTEQAFLGVYRSEGVFAFKELEYKHPRISSEQELLDWGEVWAMQELLRTIHPPYELSSPGYYINANTSMPFAEFGYALRPENKDFDYPMITLPMPKHEEKFWGWLENKWDTTAGKAFRQWVQKKGVPIEGLSVEELKQKHYRKMLQMAWWWMSHAPTEDYFVDWYRIYLDEVQKLKPIPAVQPATIWLGHAGFLQPSRDQYLETLGMDWPIEPNPNWAKLVTRIRSMGYKISAMDEPSRTYQIHNSAWKILLPDGLRLRSNCYANRKYAEWYAGIISDTINRYSLEHWGWDGHWLDGRIYALCQDESHGHVKEKCDYLVFRNIIWTMKEIRRRTRIPLRAAGGLSSAGPWGLKHVYENEHYGPHLPSFPEESLADKNRLYGWYAQSDRFIPHYKNMPEVHPRWDKHGLRYSLFSAFSMGDHAYLSEMIWFYKDKAREQADRDFFNEWVPWASRPENYRLIKYAPKRDLFGQPRTKSADRIDGSAHVEGDRGLVFLFNPSRERHQGGLIPLNRWIRLAEGKRYEVSEVYPEQGRSWGVYGYGEDLGVIVDAGSPLVLEIAATGKKVTKGRRGPEIPPGTPMAKAFLTREEVERLLAQQQQP